MVEWKCPATLVLMSVAKCIIISSWVVSLSLDCTHIHSIDIWTPVYLSRYHCPVSQSLKSDHKAGSVFSFTKCHTHQFVYYSWIRFNSVNTSHPIHSFLAACFILYRSAVQFRNENNRSSHCQVNYTRESCQYTRNDNSHQGSCCNTPHIASHPDYHSTLNKRPPQVVIE